MHQNVLTKYMKNDTYSAIDFSYGSGLWNMTIMLPEEGKTTDDIIAQLAEGGWSVSDNPLMNMNRVYEVDLKVPRFNTKSETNEKIRALIAFIYRGDY